MDRSLKITVSGVVKSGKSVMSRHIFKELEKLGAKELVIKGFHMDAELKQKVKRVVDGV